MVSRSFYNAIWTKRNALGDLLGYPREVQKNISLFLDKVLADAEDIERWEGMSPEAKQFFQPQLEEKKNDLQWLEDRLAKLAGDDGTVVDGEHQNEIQHLGAEDTQTISKEKSDAAKRTTDGKDKTVAKQVPEQYNQFEVLVHEDIKKHYSLEINHRDRISTSAD